VGVGVGVGASQRGRSAARSVAWACLLLELARLQHASHARSGWGQGPASCRRYAL